MAMLLVLGVVVALHGVTDVTGAVERSELRGASFERNEHLGCENPAPQLDCDDGLGYRDGKCIRGRWSHYASPHPLFIWRITIGSRNDTAN
jgi:hypothetical protein